MARFDPRKDVLIHKVADIETKSRAPDIRVGIYQYDGGAVKVGLNRIQMRMGDITLSSLGRINPEDLNLVVLALEKAQLWLEQNPDIQAKEEDKKAALQAKIAALQAELKEAE